MGEVIGKEEEEETIAAEDALIRDSIASEINLNRREATAGGRIENEKKKTITIRRRGRTEDEEVL